MKLTLSRTLFTGALLLSTSVADASLISSTTDLFEGATLGATSGVSSGAMFQGASPEIDPGTMSFFSDVGAGNTAFINFTTGTAGNLQGVRLLATEDGASLLHRRSMSNFKLFADADGNGSFETLLVNQAINVNYSTQPAGDVAPGGELDITFNFSSVIASSFRAEFVQGVNNGAFDGVRVVELDAIGTPVPEPATLVLLGIGLAGVGFRRLSRH